MTNTWETPVKPSLDSSRRVIDPEPPTDMSIAAWPSIDPAMPRSAWVCASPSSRLVRNSRNAVAMITIMMGPPVNSAAVNCQPISSARITPSSMTRFVEAISNAIAAVKPAPFLNSDLASATAA